MEDSDVGRFLTGPGKSKRKFLQARNVPRCWPRTTTVRHVTRLLKKPSSNSASSATSTLIARKAARTSSRTTPVSKRGIAFTRAPRTRILKNLCPSSLLPALKSRRAHLTCGSKWPLIRAGTTSMSPRKNGMMLAFPGSPLGA